MISEIVSSIFNVNTLVLIFAGVAIGIVAGAIPGLNGPIGVALLLPFTYSMTPANGLLLLGSIYMGATYGGSISGILLNCPGTGEAACTTIEGNAIAMKGRYKKALYLSILSSGFGGIVGLLGMIFFTPLLVKIALEFGPAEMFLFALAGLTIVGSILGKSPAKGFFAVFFGLLISTVGMDALTAGVARLNFDIPQLMGGINVIPVSVGLFAITEMLTLSNRESDVLSSGNDDTTVWSVVVSLIKKPILLIKSAIMGLVVGIIPGTGGAIASFVAYGEAKRSSKNADNFGSGEPEGIIAPEAANNAAVGGSFVPLLALGVPGSATSAIIFGALTLHGLEPGPSLLGANQTLVYVFMYGMLFSVLAMVIMGILGVPLFSKVLKIKTSYIVTAVLAFAMIGVYSARNSLFDIILAITFGVIGVFLKKAKVPIAPLILGAILGKILELNLRRSMVLATAAGQNILSYIFFRPIAAIVIVMVSLIIFANFKGILKKNKKVNEN